MKRRMLVALLAGATLLAAGCTSGSAGSSRAAPDGGAVADGARLALAQAADGSMLAPGVTVRGEGRVSGTPDTLTATVGVEVERDAVQPALDAANEAAQNVIDAVRDAGVAEEDIQTRQFSVQPRYHSPRPDAPPEINGYMVSNLVSIKIRDLDRSGDVLQAAVQAGGDAARVQSVAFSLEDNEALLEAARESAFADARAKAEQYAGLSGRDLGALVSVAEQQSSQPPVEQYLEAEMTRDTAASVPIQPGQQEVTVSVTTVWELS